MIRSFRSKALAELWAKGRTAKIDGKLRKRILIRLDRLNAASAAAQMNLPGFDFHALKGFIPTRYSVHVNGPCGNDGLRRARCDDLELLS